MLGLIFLLNPLLPAGTRAQLQEQTPQSTNASQSAPPGASPTSSGQLSTLLALRGVLVSTASLLGSKVRDLQGEKVGTVQHLLINPRTGLVLYAVVSIGGFLGMGEKTLIVPWQALEVTRDDNALGLNISEQWLQQAPADAAGAQSLKE
jgi:sporulation protein YlmC with PRC-barrel domain